MLQVTFSVLAGLALFALVKDLLKRDRDAGMILAGGLVLRALAAQLIFWISYLHLPVAPQLQLGNGLWFFAQDGQLYLAAAIDLAERGVGAIIAAPRSSASVSYLQTLSAFVFVLGRSAFVAVLLNLFSYALTCQIIAWWGCRWPSARRPMLFALIVLTLSPASVLWSLQPLKDTFFQLVVIAFLAGAAAWNKVWAERQIQIPMLAGSLAVMTVALWAMAGVRWYFAFAALLAAAIFFVHIVVRVAPRPVLCAALSCLALVVFARVFLIEADPYLPPPVRAIVSATLSSASPVAMTDDVLSLMDTARTNFERSGGATAIVQHPTTDTGNALSAPSTLWSKLRAGTAALFIPTSVQKLMGFGAITGGRGMLWLTDIDTMFFDASLALALWWSVILGRRNWTSNSVLVLVFLLTVVIGGPMLYTVTNFGTLFRLRGMILATSVLLPLAAVSARSGTSREAERIWAGQLSMSARTHDERRLQGSNTA